MDKKKGIFEKLKGLKGKEIVIAIVAVVIMLVIYFSSTGAQKTKSNADGARDYLQSVEINLSMLVKNMSGDNNAETLVTWECSEEKVIAYSESETASGHTKTPTIIQSQNGNECVVIKTIYPKAKSVAVVTKNGNDAKMRVSLQQMISIALDISPEKVAVYSSNK